jgi:hypothetical protein
MGIIHTSGRLSSHIPPVINPLLASPHPLDFDWRFDEATVAKLCELVRCRDVVALGAPSVARGIEASGGRVLLVDRQPVQNVRNHLLSDVPTVEVPESGFDIAIIDAPWYPNDLVEWYGRAGRRSCRAPRHRRSGGGPIERSAPFGPALRR